MAAGDGSGHDETRPGAGEIDQLAVLRAMRETGFAGGLMPEHQPALDADPAGVSSRAWTVGTTARSSRSSPQNLSPSLMPRTNHFWSVMKTSAAGSAASR